MPASKRKHEAKPPQNPPVIASLTPAPTIFPQLFNCPLRLGFPSLLLELFSRPFPNQKPHARLDSLTQHAPKKERATNTNVPHFSPIYGFLHHIKRRKPSKSTTPPLSGLRNAVSHTDAYALGMCFHSLVLSAAFDNSNSHAKSSKKQS